MLTRIALLYSITWLATLRRRCSTVLGNQISGRDLILFVGGLFLMVKSPWRSRHAEREAVGSVNPACSTVIG